MSPSMRGRGLKRCLPILLCIAHKSPSMRGRGLKPDLSWGVSSKIVVALHAGAWIETVDDVSLVL